MHPSFSFKDSQGNVLAIPDIQPGTISVNATCGQCHDVKYIDTFHNHFKSKMKADCLVCHYTGRQFDGDLTQAHLRIKLPATQDCAVCHGITNVSKETVDIPRDYLKTIDYTHQPPYYYLTQHTGTIFSSQDVSDSVLNIKEKQSLHFPWDVHARRQLDCSSCHYIGNDPAFPGASYSSSLDYLKKDPRRVQSIGEILKRPDHRLKNATCTDCHDAMKVHDKLPYKKRHTEVLSCQSCHIPHVYGPAFQTIDRTVVSSDGSPVIDIRGVDESRSSGSSIDTKYIEGYKPFLLSTPASSNTYLKSNTNAFKISPYNLITQWSWIAKKTGKPVPEDFVKRVFLNGSRYDMDILVVFDTNKDGKIDRSELRLDSKEKVEKITRKLELLGIQEPVISGTIDAYPVNHGVRESVHTTLDCADCHSRESRMGEDVLLSNFAPGGILPTFSPSSIAGIEGKITLNKQGNVALERDSSLTRHYVFGYSRSHFLYSFGFWIFIVSILFILIHGLARYISSRRNPVTPEKAQTVYMYRFYERLWHWTMATAVILLAITGLEIHYTGRFNLFGLQYAVSIHNILSVILVVNAALSLFYHLVSGEIKHFFYFTNRFIKETILQVYYYIHGIFKGHSHPIPKSIDRKLNPLQQIVYVLLLNILLPFQVITGIAIWGVEKWPTLFNALNGLTYLAPLHHFGSWLFLSFLAVHIYLTTTGHTVLSNIKAMVTGYDDIPESEGTHDYHHMMEQPLGDMVGTIIRKITSKPGTIPENKKGTGKKNISVSSVSSVAKNLKKGTGKFDTSTPGTSGENGGTHDNN